MHALMVRVLEQKQLNSAGQLFKISDYDVITDLHTAFTKIKRIFNEPGYIDNRVDQSVVEIVIARITAAIRETGSIETYCAEMIDVLDSCLRHKMSIYDPSGELIDSPHCKIAADLMSSLFLHYSKKSVMTLAIPAAIVALGCGHADLVKSTTSYISLAAIHNGKALAQYSIQIISHIINGNTSLLRVLPQIYSDNREAVHAHFSQLMRLLDSPSTDCAERISLLQLASIVANNKPDLLLPFLPQLIHFLLSPSTCTAVLHIFLSLISQERARDLSEYLPTLCDAAGRSSFQSNLPTFAKVISMIGSTSFQQSCMAMDRLVECCHRTDAHSLPLIINQIEILGERWPMSLVPHLSTITTFAKVPGMQRQIERIVALTGAQTSASHDDVTVISIREGGEDDSSESLLSKRSTKPHEYIKNNNIITSGTRTYVSVCDSSVDASAQELDKNTQSLALAYQNRSNSSLSKQRSRSFVSILPGISNRSCSENVTMGGSRELSTASVGSSVRAAPAAYAVSRPPPVYQPPKSTTLPSSVTNPVNPPKEIPSRRPWVYPGSYETTFPAHAGPITTTKMTGGAIEEEDEESCRPRWNDSLDRGDVVHQFVDHRRGKIRRFVQEVTARLPIPIQCTVESTKGKNHMRVHFACQVRGAHCIFNSDFLFAFKTKMAATWLHLMFLQMESTSIECTGEVVSQASPSFTTLSHCWHCLPSSVTKGKQFVALVTSAFPSTKDQNKLLKELDEANHSDCFSLDAATNKWSCFSCSHPEKIRNFVEEKMLEGQLKEKRGRWKFLRRWQTKYFTLSPGALTYSSSVKNNSEASSMLLPAIDLKKIRSVKSLSRGRKSRKSLRKAFEIFTSDSTSYVLKASDEKKAEEWMQCLQIAVAHARREVV